MSEHEKETVTQVTGSPDGDGQAAIAALGGQIDDMLKKLQSVKQATAPAISRREQVAIAALQTLIGAKSPEQREDAVSLVKEAFRYADAFEEVAGG